MLPGGSGTQCRGTLLRRIGRSIQALGALLAAPSADLLTYIAREAREGFEVREVRERPDLASELQRDFEVVDRAYQTGKNLRLMRSIAPCLMRQSRHRLGIGTKVCPDAVLVISAESADGCLNLEQQTFRRLHDWRGHERHVSLPIQRANY
jgi:hypothetical protein